MICCAASLTVRRLFSGFAFLIFISLIIFLREAESAEFNIIPSLRIKEEYNDNIFFSTDDRKKDFLTTLSPAIELINRTEKLDSSLLARLNVLRYINNEGLNDVEQNYRGRLRYSLHPKLKLSADAGYTRDSRPDRDIEVSGLVMKPVTRHWQNYAAGAEYTFSEKTRASLSYSYERSDFNDPEFVDIKAHDLSLGFTHDLSQYFSATMGRMNLGYGRYEFQDSTVDYYYATIGMSQALSEKWNILIDAGGSYTRSEFEVETLELVPPFFYRVVREPKKEEEGGLVGQAALSYNGERTNGELAFSHRVMPAVGRAGAAERTSLTIQVRRRFTYELSGRLSAGYYINKSERGKFSTAPLDEETWRVNPVIRYEFTKDVALEAFYSYAFVKDKQANTDAQRNLFMVNFIIQHPLFE